jgi:hypothetical protein
VFFLLIVVDGEIVGIWKRTVRARGIHVQLAPFHSLTARAVSGMRNALERYGTFLGVPVSIAE